MNGYCIKCREEKEIEDFQKVTSKDKKRWLRGECPGCGTTVWQCLPQEQKDLDLVVTFHLS